MMTNLHATDVTEKILAAVRALEPAVNSGLAQMDRDARMPDKVIQGMLSAGVFRAAVPKVYDGLELDPVSQMRIVEECARLDGSMGWLAMIGISGGYLAAFLEPAAAHQLFAAENHICAGQGFFSDHVAEVVPGGYRLSGRFRFASGINHAGIVFCGVAAKENGQTLLTANGTPRHHMLMIPADQAKIIKTWDTTGMRGTGSHDFTLDNVFIPTAFCSVATDPPKVDSPLYKCPNLFLVFQAGVPLGIARAVLDTARALCKTKRVLPGNHLLQDDTRTQHCIGRAETMLAAARTYTYTTVADLWKTTCAGETLSLQQRIDGRMMMVHAHEVGKQVVDDIVSLVATSFFVGHSVFDRGLRDITTACQHRQSHTRLYADGGRAYLGMDATFPWF